VVPINLLVDPKAFIINMLWYESLVKKRSPQDCTISIRKFDGVVSNINKKLFKINGIYIRGGVLDLSTGILANESTRDIHCDLGMVTLEFNDFDRSKYDFLEGEPSMPFYVKPDQLQACNMEEDFLLMQKKIITKRDFKLRNLINTNKKIDLATKNISQKIENFDLNN